jgi:ankyrin repeat protein
MQGHESFEWRNTTGATPLMYAANQGHITVAEVLLRHGADVNVVALEHTALHHALQASNAALVELVVKYRARLFAGLVTNGVYRCTLLHETLM